jgi:hypothetical protein
MTIRFDRYQLAALDFSVITPTIVLLAVKRKWLLLKQTHTRKLSPLIRTALDNISSIAVQKPTHCLQCGTLMNVIDADLWLEGSDQRWSIKLPVCVECNSEDINAILSKVS